MDVLVIDLEDSSGSPLILEKPTAMKQKQSDMSKDFSDALSREKLMAKGLPPQPRGDRVVPGVSAHMANEIVSEVDSHKATNSFSAGSKQILTLSKRSSSAGVQKQTDPPITGPPKRSNSSGMNSITAAQDVKDYHEDAKGLFGILVQTRRCEELCAGLGLTSSDVRKMKRKYDDNDMYHSGEITQAEFFFMLNEERRPLTLGLFKFADVPESQKFLSFDQYLNCVVNFAALTKPELYQFVFDLYDDDQSGALDEREFAKMSLELQSKQFHFSANVAMAIKILEGKENRAAFAPDDGLVDFDEFMKFAKNFPVAFYPIMNMQKNVRTSTLGESRWSHITANKLKVQELVSYMRRHQGAIPQLTFWESVAIFFSSERFNIRKRASELYALELAQHRRLSIEEVDVD